MTFLLGDIQGSVQMWAEDDQSMAAATERFEDAVTDLVGRHRGVRPTEQGEGDSFVAAFDRASDAVASALDMQRILDLPVRMAIHTGEAQVRTGGNYMGAAISRCARLRDIGHGGQVLLSQPAAELVAERMPAGATLADLGLHQLRDLSRPEHVRQLCHPDLPTEFPPLKSLDAFPHNLPVRLSRFIGRSQELALCRALLAEARLLTLTGSGGCGKTRLAVQLAADSIEAYPQGIWFADLGHLADPDLLGTPLAGALGVDGVDQVVATLGRGTVLVVLDNCEHLVDACADLASHLLRSCPISPSWRRAANPWRWKAR